MRRLLIVLCVAALAVAVLALPGAAKEKPLPDPVFFAEGEFRLGAVEARTGEYAGDSGPFPEGYIGGVPGWFNFMDPERNYCNATGTLEWIGKNTAILTQYDDVVMGSDGVNRCPTRGVLPAPKPDGIHERIVHITKSGSLKTYPTTDFWKNVPALTGCALNGTFPVYHGSFDGETLRMTSHFHSFCDGGTAWSKFNIDAEDGPIHVTYELELRVTPTG